MSKYYLALRDPNEPDMQSLLTETTTNYAAIMDAGRILAPLCARVTLVEIDAQGLHLHQDISADGTLGVVYK